MSSSIRSSWRTLTSMMPSVSPFEGGICCINKSDNQSSISSPSISTVVSSAWPSPDEEVDGGPDSNNHHQSSAVQDSTGEEDSDYFTSMCCDDLLTYTAVSVVQPHHRPMMMMTTMMPSTGVLGDGLMSSTSHHQASAAAVADYMAQQLLPIGTASAAVQLHQHQQQQHNSSTSSTATKTIPLFLDDPLCDGDDQNNGGLTENGPIKNEIVDSSCKSSITDDWTNKNPSDWTQDDAIAWLFTTAKEGGVPEGVITATNNHPPLVDSGAQLARMSLSDYRQKYGPEYGVVFYRAFRQILAVQQHHQMLVNNGPSSQHQHHHQMMTGSNDLTNLQNFSAGMQQQHHYQNNNGCSWSTTNMSSLESDSYQHQQQQNNNNLIIPDQQQHHLVEMLNGYDTTASAGGSISRQHHQQQQLFSSGMDCSNPYNGQHQSAQMGNGLNYMQQQHHQLNNNINAKYGADPIHQHHQHQQDGYYPNNCYSSLDGIIGGDHMEFPESYSNGTPSDPDEIGSTLNGSESGCNSISGATHQHNHLSASGNNTGGHGGSTTTKRVGRPSGTKSSSNINRRRKPADYADRGYGKLWEFIRDLLHNKLYCPTMIRWENVDEGVFRIVQSEKLAALWGELKHNPRMTYEKLSRAMRYYYKSKVFLPVLGRRLVYKFGPHAVDWKPENPNFERMDHHLHHIT